MPNRSDLIFSLQVRFTLFLRGESCVTHSYANTLKSVCKTVKNYVISTSVNLVLGIGSAKFCIKTICEFLDFLSDVDKNTFFEYDTMPQGNLCPLFLQSLLT